MKRYYILLVFLVFLFSIPRITASTQSHQIQFKTYFISGDNVARDFYIAVDGSNVAHDVLSGSGTLSASVSLDDSSSHYVTAWPIINHDRSRYGGSLSIDGQTCAQSTDVWQNAPLGCSIPAAHESYTVTFESYFISGDNVARDFYIEVDGATVAHGVFTGSGTLTSSPMNLNYGATHYVDAWPIINRDRSIYGGRLYVNGQLCGQSSDVHQNNRLACLIQANGTVIPIPEFSNGAVPLAFLAAVLSLGYLARRRSYRNF